MATTAIQIELDDELARIYNEASPDEQRRAQFILSVFLRGMADDEPESLKSVMDRIGANAHARGLTPEILEDLLNDDE